MSENTKSKSTVIPVKQLVAGWPKVGYSNKDDPSNFYSKTKGARTKRTSMFYKKKLADIFIFAMALGVNERLKKDYNRGERKDTIDAEYIAQTSEYIWMMIAVAIQEDNSKLLKNPHNLFDEPRKIIDICEKYANYGIDLLIDIDEEPAPDPYAGYEKKFKEVLDRLRNK